MLSSRQFTSFPSTLNRAVHFIPTSLAGNFKEFPALAWLLNTCRCLGLCFFLPVPVRTATETAFNLKALWWFHFGGPTQLVFLSIYVFSLQPLMDSGDFHSWLLSDRRLHSESNTMDEVGWCSLSLPASLKWGDLSDWFLCAPEVATWIFSSAICPFNSWSSLTWARSFTSWLAAVLMAATWLWRAAYQNVSGQWVLLFCLEAFCLGVAWGRWVFACTQVLPHSLLLWCLLILSCTDKYC